MTYFAELDPNSPLVAADEAAHEAWDAEVPNWRDMAAGESARYVSEDDVQDAEAFLIVGYGGDHRKMIPGRDD